MCSHYIAEKPHQQLTRMGMQLPIDWQPPAGRQHVYPT